VQAGGQQILHRVISNKLALHGSPKQIAGWLKRTYPNKKQCQVSHETIYENLFIQARGVLKKEWLQYLRSKRTLRHAKHSSLKPSGLEPDQRGHILPGKIADAIMRTL